MQLYWVNRILCFVSRRTFYNLLWVICEKLAERGPLGPLQSVQELLDLRGHSAVHGNSYTKDEVGEGIQSHTSCDWNNSNQTGHIITVSAALHPTTHETIWWGWDWLYCVLGMKRSIPKWLEYKETTVRAGVKVDLVGLHVRIHSV